jgi:hypothetical protein
MPPSPRSRWIHALAHIVLFAVAVCVYTLTMNPDVQPADSGEFQVAAITLGIPHPPGYPLYTMLGWLFAQVPVGSPYARVTFLSVVASALTLVLVSLTIQRLINAYKPGGTCGANYLPLMAGLLGALALGSSTTFWAQATTTNIRSLTAFFTALMLYAVSWLYQVATTVQKDSGTQRTGTAVLALFALALGLGIEHHVSLVFVGAVLGVLVIILITRLRLGWRSIVSALVILAITQLVWAYLPLRDAAGARFAPGNLTTLSGLLFHIFARGFAGDMLAFAAPEYLFDRLSILPTLFTFEFSWPILIVALLSALALIWRRRGVGIALAGAFAVHLFITITYRAPQTVEYAMPAWVILCVLLGSGAGILAQESVQWLSTAQGLSGIPTVRNGLVAGVPVLLMLAVAGVLLRDGAERFPSFLQLSADRSTRQAAAQVLMNAAPGGAVLAPWHQATPLWALQDVEDLRTDVRVEYVYPRGARPYADTFSDQTAASAQERPTYVTSLYAVPFQERHLTAVPLTPGWQVLTASVISNSKPTTGSLVFDGRIEVMPVQAVSSNIEVGQALGVIVSYRAVGPISENESLTVRIMRADGTLASNADIRLDPTMALDEQRSRKVTLGIPMDLSPGAYSILAGAYQVLPDGFSALKERGGEVFAPSGSVTVTPGEQAPVTLQPMHVQTASGAMLVGVDYDTGLAGKLRLLTHWQLSPYTSTVTVQDAMGNAVARPHVLPATKGAYAFFSLVFDIPPMGGIYLATGDTGARVRLPDASGGERYIPYADQMVLVGSSVWREGDQLKVDLRWLSARAITTDYIVSARVDGVGGGNFHAAHDGVPALGALPTLKWIRGSCVTDRHPFTLGNYRDTLRGTVVVYNNFTQQVLPPLDERYQDGITFSVP